MTDVQSPDGSIARFPDDMSNSDIEAVMQKQFPPEQPQDPGFLANSARALRMGLPFGNQMVAAEKTILPEALGGSKGFDYYGNLADVNAADAQLQQQHPHLAALGQGTAGAALSTLVPGAALGEGAGVIPQMVRGAGAGFGIGALQGAGAPGSGITNIPQTAENAIKGGYAGGALGGAIPGAMALAGKAISPLAAGLSREPPQAGGLTPETIGPAKTAAYKAVDELGASYTPEQYKGLVDKITADAQAADIDPDLHKGAASVIKNLQKRAESGEPISLTQLDQKRQLIGRDASSTPGDKFFGSQIRSNIDDFIANQQPSIGGAQVEGEWNPAANAIENARALNTQYMKSQALAEALSDAELRTGATYSGGNIDNATRQNLLRVFNKGNFTPEETQQYTNAIMGGAGQNMLRRVGKMLNPSGIIGYAEASRALAGDPLGLAAAGTGYGAKKAADAMTQANVQRLMATILAGGKGPAAPPSTGLISPRAGLAAALSANANLQSPQPQNLPTR